MPYILSLWHIIIYDFLCCQGFKSHKLHNALEAPGEADLTSDVDFLFLRNCLANMNGKSQDRGAWTDPMSDLYVYVRMLLI